MIGNRRFGPGQTPHRIGGDDRPPQRRVKEFRRARRAKSDRKRHARPQRNAVMRHAGRKIQHVPLLQHKRLVRLEIRQHIHIDIRHGPLLFGGQRPGPNPPFAPPQPLNQKHVVAVHVRPHVPAVRRVTRHNVVEPPRRRKPKTLEKGRRLGNPAIHLLHQQTPVRFGKIRKILLRERAMAKFPGVVPAALQNEPRNSLFLHRQARQFLRREGRFEIRKRVPNEERLLPPPVAQKRIDRHASRQAFGQIGQITGRRHVGAQDCRGKNSAKDKPRKFKERPEHQQGENDRRRLDRSGGPGQVVPAIRTHVRLRVDGQRARRTFPMRRTLEHETASLFYSLIGTPPNTP